MLLQKRLVLKISKTLISQDEIENKISEIAEIINSKYKDEELVVIGILKGAFMIVSDLAKQLQVDVTFDFMSIKSYYGSKSSGQIKIVKDPQMSLIDTKVNNSDANAIKHDFTLEVIKYPKRYEADDMLEQDSFKHKIIVLLSKIFYFFIPTYIWVLEKP